MKYATFSYLLLLGSIFRQLNLTIILLVFYTTMSDAPVSLKRTCKEWLLIAPGIFAVVAYAVVYTEHRYVAAFVSLFWIALFAGIRLPADKMSKWMAASFVVIIFFTTALTVTWSIFNSTKIAVIPHSQVATAFAEHGFQPGDEIAVIADEPFGDGGAFVARLARLRIVAQTRDLKEFYAASPRTRAELYEAFRRAEAKAILLHGKRPEDALRYQWRELASGFFLLDNHDSQRP